MATPFIGEVRMCGFQFAPVDWAMCNGQSLQIAQYNALYALIGTTYGGDGIQTFNLPNLQGRLCVNQGQGTGLSPYVMGQMAGTESVTLTTSNLPQHNHTLSASTNTVTTNVPAGNLLGAGQTTSPGTAYFYTTSSPVATGTLAPQTVANTGGSLPHENRMPSLCVTFIIALAGIFPSRN
jgi:microcystin-dependent protein